MNVPATISITSASVGLLAALLTSFMASALGRKDLRWFALCAAFASLFNLTNAPVTLRLPVATVLVISRLNLFFGGLHTLVWFKFFAAQDHRPNRTWEKLVMLGGGALSVLTLVPGVVLESRLYIREVRWLGVTYADAPPTLFGGAVYAYHAIGLVVVFALSVRRALRHQRDGLGQSLAIGSVMIGAIHDSLASSGVLEDPYILDVAVLTLVLAASFSLTRSIVDSARALETSSRDLAIAHAELVKRERLAALGELAAVVAHEVRNPLAVVFNATAGLRKAAPGSPDHEALTAIIQEEAEHLRDIVSDLLEFARPRPPVFAPVTLEDVVRSAVEAARGAVTETVTVEVSVDSALPAVTCDERLIRQAVINLVTNALQTPERKKPVRVHVGMRGLGGRLRSFEISVADDGVGIPIDQRERVFTPFYSTKPSGTGLGLAVVRSSADAHGGEISLEETEGGGATFILRFPERRA